MKQSRFLLVMVALLGFGAALAQDETVTVEAMKQLKQQWSEFFAANDPVSRASLYAEDATWDNIDEQTLSGQAEIQALFESQSQDFTEGGTNIFEDREAVTFGDWGYTSGLWTYQDPEGSFNQGYYVTIMRMVDGDLKVIRDVWNLCPGGFCPEE